MSLNKENMKAFKTFSDDGNGQIEHARAFFKLVEEFSKKRDHYHEIRQDNDDCVNFTTRILINADGKYKFGIEINKCDITYREFEISNPSITINTNWNTLSDAILHDFEILGRSLKNKEKNDFLKAASLINYVGDYLSSLAVDFKP
jgi:hypothetical protein